MTLIEDYLFDIYKPTTNKQLYFKLYYQKNKEKILNYNLKRYSDRLNKGETKFVNKKFTIKFD